MGTPIPLEHCRLAETIKNDPGQWKFIGIEGKLNNHCVIHVMYLVVIFSSTKQLKKTFVTYTLFTLNLLPSTHAHCATGKVPDTLSMPRVVGVGAHRYYLQSAYAFVNISISNRLYESGMQERNQFSNK